MADVEAWPGIVDRYASELGVEVLFTCVAAQQSKSVRVVGVKTCGFTKGSLCPTQSVGFGLL